MGSSERGVDIFAGTMPMLDETEARGTLENIRHFARLDLMFCFQLGNNVFEPDETRDIQSFIP